MDDTPKKSMSPKWLAFIRRLSSAAELTLKNNTTGGIVLMHAVVIVDANGEALFWLSPNVHRIEPSATAKDDILRIMTQFPVE
jgi:hypothetical protein